MAGGLFWLATRTGCSGSFSKREGGSAGLLSHGLLKALLQMGETGCKVHKKAITSRFYMYVARHRGSRHAEIAELHCILAAYSFVEDR